MTKSLLGLIVVIAIGAITHAVDRTPAPSAGVAYDLPPLQPPHLA